MSAENRRDQGKAKRRAQRVARLRAETLEDRRLLATFTVINTDDTGLGSLRQAIEDANALVGPDRIEFAIPGAGIRSIRPVTALPALFDPVTVDATTQPGYAGTPIVELNGSAAPVDSAGLDLAAGTSTIRGLAINRFFRGIIAGGPNNRIVGNFIGTDAAGTLDLGNADIGLLFFGDGNVVGGPSPADRNVIAGNDGPGIFLNTESDRNIIVGNSIGTDISGGTRLGNGSSGIIVLGSDNRIGGELVADGNTIAFNSVSGIQIGTFFSGSTGNTVGVNSIFENGGLGIDVAFGANGGQSPPDLGTAFPSGGTTRVEGTVRGRSSSPFTLRFFSSPAPDPTGVGEGRTFVGSTVVLSELSGQATFALDLPAAVAIGQVITATATDGLGNSSSFSRAVPIAATATADLDVQLFPGSSARVGEPVTFFASVTNFGPARASGVGLSVPLSAGLSFLGGDSPRGPATLASGVITAPIGALGSGESVTVRLDFVPTADGRITLSATADGEQDDPVPLNDTSRASIDIQPELPANLGIAGFADSSNAILGDEFNATFLVVNGGPNDRATNVRLSVIIPEGLMLVGINPSQGTASMTGSTVTVALGAVDAGIQPAVRLRLKAIAPGPAILDASVAADQVDPDQLNNALRVGVAIDPSQPADVGVSIVSAPNPILAGQLSTYSLTVSNFGPGTAEGVLLTNPLPQGVELVGTAQSSQGSVAVVDGALTASLGTLPPSFTALISYTVRPLVPGGLVNVARVTANGSDFNPANNQAASFVSVVIDEVLPVVTAQRLRVERGGIRAIVLTFNKPLNAGLSTAPENFQLNLEANRRGRGGAAIAIGSITYDPTGQTITLVPASPLSIGRLYRLTVNGQGAPGVEDLNGTVLDGDYNNLPDGIFTSQIGRGASSRPVPFQRGPVGVQPRPANRNRAAAAVEVAATQIPKPRPRPNQAKPSANP